MLITSVFFVCNFEGPHTSGTTYANKLTSVGQEIPGVTTKLLKVDDNVEGDMEVRVLTMSGRITFAC